MRNGDAADADGGGTPDGAAARRAGPQQQGDASAPTPMTKAIAKSAAEYSQNPTEREAERVYLKNVVAKLCCTDDWTTQERLLPVLQALLGYSPQEMAKIEAARLSFAPLAEQFYAFTKPRPGAPTTATGW